MAKVARKSKAPTKGHRPTSARLLKHRPEDPPAKPRQARLPEMEDPEIAELETAAEQYAVVRDERIALNVKEKTLKDLLLATMKKNDKKKYHHGAVDIEIVPEAETVKVRINKKEDAPF